MVSAGVTGPEAEEANVIQSCVTLPCTLLLSSDARTAFYRGRSEPARFGQTLLFTLPQNVGRADRYARRGRCCALPWPFILALNLSLNLASLAMLLGQLNRATQQSGTSR